MSATLIAAMISFALGVVLAVAISAVAAPVIDRVSITHIHAYCEFVTQRKMSVDTVGCFWRENKSPNTAHIVMPSDKDVPCLYEHEYRHYVEGAWHGSEPRDVLSEDCEYYDAHLVLKPK